MAVVTPMLGAVGTLACQPDRIGRFDADYPAISTTMIVLSIGGVTAESGSVTPPTY